MAALAGLGLLAGCAAQRPAPDAVITGVAVTAEPVILPPEAVFEATLLDVSQPDLAPVVLGRQRLDPAGQPPFALHILYPSAFFVHKGQYEVRAMVSLDNRVLWTSAWRYPVPEDAAYRNVGVRLLRVLPQPATQDASVPLALTHWRLTAVDGVPVPGRPTHVMAPSLVFHSDRPRATGFGGCNRFFVDFEMQGGQLRLGSVTSGIALCLDSGALEGRYLGALARVARFRQDGAQLTLRDATGEPVLVFEALERPLG